jgi:hypothetical protein
MNHSIALFTDDLAGIKLNYSALYLINFIVVDLTDLFDFVGYNSVKFV